jgi:hypothetical protein
VTLRTRYDFVLPRGYVDRDGTVHRDGTMRLATARDELEPLRDPLVEGAEDPRLTVLVLARVVERFGTLEMVTPHEIEGLFAVDLAFLQDFYGVINFGTEDDYRALMEAQQELVGDVPAPAASPAGAASPTPAPSERAAGGDQSESPPGLAAVGAPGRSRPGRSAIEEIPGGR